MAIQGICPPSHSHSHSPSPSHSPSHSHSPYYQLLERGSARLGRVKKNKVKISQSQLKNYSYS